MKYLRQDPNGILVFRGSRCKGSRQRELFRYTPDQVRNFFTEALINKKKPFRQHFIAEYFKALDDAKHTEGIEA